MKRILFFIFVFFFLIVSSWASNFEETKKKAEQGDSDAQYRLAMMYGQGQNVGIDITRAIYWLTEAANQENPDAQFLFGFIYLTGDEVEKDYEKAFHWLSKAAEKGVFKAQLYLGAMYDLGSGVVQDLNMAKHWYREAAKRDADIECSIYGAINDLSGEPNYKERIGFWLNKAYENECELNFHSLQKLGESYFYGHGVPQNYSKALEFFGKVADNSNYVPLYFFFGEYYYNGLANVSKDLKKGIYGYLRAARYGYEKAETKLQEIFGEKSVFSLEGEKRIYWITKGAELEYAEFQYELGEIKRRKKEYEQALYWFFKAAGHGDSRAQYSLGEMYSEGEGTPKSYIEAFKWYKKAAEQGNSWAQNNLGVLYSNGHGTLQNYISAYAWYNLSAAQDDETAINNRDSISAKMTPYQIAEAQELSREFQNQIDTNINTKKEFSESNKSTSNEKEIRKAGTGFLITKDGFILTCNHVVENAESIEVLIEKKTYIASVVCVDESNDLALLKISGDFPALALSLKNNAELGQKVFTIGYPNLTLQGMSEKYTDGSISGLTGFQDDVRLYQISVPVQPGNSGGPLLDENGNVIGIIVAMLDAQAAFNISGSLPQNVNYAVKSIYAQGLLSTRPELADKLLNENNGLFTVNIVEKVKNCVVIILAY